MPRATPRRTYIADQLEQLEASRLSRIAYGMPLGGDLEYADHVTVGTVARQSTLAEVSHRPQMGRTNNGPQLNWADKRSRMSHLARQAGISAGVVSLPADPQAYSLVAC